MAGLIVTCARHFEPDACDEIEKILADLGDESAYARATSMSGIITVETSLDPENAINDVRALIDDEPWVVRYLMRLIPSASNGLIKNCPRAISSRYSVPPYPQDPLFLPSVCPKVLPPLLQGQARIGQFFVS